jgi:hypothetical protein
MIQYNDSRVVGVGVVGAGVDVVGVGVDVVGVGVDVVGAGVVGSEMNLILSCDILLDVI